MKMHLKLKHIIIFTIFFLGINNLFSFEITLIDGRILKGEFKRKELMIKTSDGEECQISVKDIYSIKQNKMPIYLNTDHKYSFNVPEDWDLKADSVHGKRLVQLKGPALHGGKITILSQPFKQGRTFFDFVQESLKDIKKNEFKLNDKRVFEKSGFDDGLKFDLEVQVSGKTLCTEQISLYRSSIRTNILITCVYHPTEKYYITKIIKNFIDSFKAL
ncbi:hypothetical protein KAJ27_09845 [bacterium]|nr:hypothetical protein [bacterium]